MLHTSRELPYSCRVEAIEEFCQKMSNSGHHLRFMQRIVIAGICKYEVKVKQSELEKDNPAFKPLYLGTRFQEMKRWKVKVQAKETWYMDKDGEEDIDNSPIRMKNMKTRPRPSLKTSQKAGKKNKIKTSTVMFVPSSKGGTLIRIMQENEDKLASITNFRVKYQEAGGVKLGNLFSTNLAKGKHCERRECYSCEVGGDKRPNCKQQSVLYESVCQECKSSDDSSIPQANRKEPKSRRGVYYGETSRSLHERAQEHVRDAIGFDQGSHMVKHWMNDHPDLRVRPRFKFAVIGVFKDCLSRQVAEAMRLMMTNDSILNSKNEYLQNCIPRIVVEESKFERMQREREEELNELEEKKRVEKFKKEMGTGKRTMAALEDTPTVTLKADQRK